ncbi:Cilia- and flagella-associated protein 157 [Caenorhabditis elegans]|uniref:Cilia- and flagella-associated protein 157 n=1 Tax=Caenorhabditis elegans TaxID=6239 RepID=Q23600_CAEEL|nr:Cilia- and flagella-associated protein 157 [Caenorhabditis elegans]CAA92639.2 Cilia- and flagella-associated protein 157 [Caenorhabditis elegans]|eukprot:NP_001023624.1 Uncharacterized protein CELE_ZK809.5 [Caenorhabditis elegans]
MGSKQQIGVLKRDGIGKQYFDMENILTRSLYRVLNSSTQVPPHIVTKSQNVDKMSFPDRKSTIAVARPNNHQIGNASSVDMDMQMRLLAQEICGRVERKYERKLEDVRERDRRDTERRLISIRSEYESKYQLQLGKLEKEKNRLLDQIAERERTLEHRMEMRSAEREHDLVAKQRTVENRAIELTLNKENFEKCRDEWQRKMELEMEELRLERERIEVASLKSTDKRRSDMAIEAEISMWKKRTAELEHDANETRKRVGEMMEDNFRLKNQISSVGQIQKELDVTMTSLNETREELAVSRVEVRRTGDYDQLKEENDQLRIEIELLRQKTSQKVKIAVEETIAEYSAKEAKWKRIAGLSQQRIAVLSEKLKDSEIERDVLRQEMKTMQKMVGRSSAGRQGHNQKNTESRKIIRSISPSGSTSSLSDGELEILNIRQRIQNLDDIAKELDASVEHFSTGGASRKLFDKNETNVELYDDFCRALHSSVMDEEGSPLHMTSSPQKPTQNHKRKIEIPVNEKSMVSTSQVTDQDEWLKRGIRVISPPAMKRSPVVRPESPEVILESEKIEVKIEQPPVKTIEPELTEFEKRMQARSAAKDDTDRRNRILQLATDPETSIVKPKSPEPTEEPAKPTSADNPMFAGVDPVMAEYMKKVLAARNQNQTTLSAQPTIQVAPVVVPPKSTEVEVTLADELDLELDQPTNADDDWW